jgi:hypothetical protein
MDTMGILRFVDNEEKDDTAIDPLLDNEQPFTDLPEAKDEQIGPSLCPLCQSQAMHLPMEEPVQVDQTTGAYGKRNFCLKCEFDFMFYDGKSQNVPMIICDLTVRNLRAAQRTTIFHMETLHELMKIPSAVMDVIAQYTWFVMPWCDFRHIPIFPRSSSLIFRRPCDAKLSPKCLSNDDPTEHVVSMVGMPGDELCINEIPERCGMYLSEGGKAMYYLNWPHLTTDF